ncbi:MAG: NADH-quinone oxidoreductase subunit J [Armatimonadetes bacterium]|nr:NADH-quinone oxidoreductase subunit J [Armatimonadota bacterium]
MTWIPFVLIAAVAVFFALYLVLSKNAVHGALSLVLVLVSLAIFFLLLGAEFIFIVQVAVYAGAIMVLFLFVMMLLNVGGAEGPLRENPSWQLAAAIVLGCVLLFEAALHIARAGEGVRHFPQAIAADFGSPERIGQLLFSSYLLPFEITSLVLLAAMIGAVVLALRRFP